MMKFRKGLATVTNTANIRHLPTDLPTEVVNGSPILCADEQYGPIKRAKFSPTPRCEEAFDEWAMETVSSEPEIKKSILQCLGQLKLSVYMNCGLLTIHIVQARGLTNKTKSQCDSYIKMSLYPDDAKRTHCKTEMVYETNNPVYDEKFSFELLDGDKKKRLLISIWHRDIKKERSEFLGCMSFGLKHLLATSRTITGWYYLLTEDIGRKKHLRATETTVPTQPPLPQKKVPSNIPPVNKDVLWMESITLVIGRGRKGYGFTVLGSSPVRIGRVDEGSQAHKQGLEKGDCLVRINGQNVSRSSAESIVRIIRLSTKQIVLDVQRARTVTDIPEPHVTLMDNVDRNQNIEKFKMADDCKENMVKHAGISTVPPIGTPKKLMDEERRTQSEPNLEALNTSSVPQIMIAYQDLTEQERMRQQDINDLITLEREFVMSMQHGIQRFSRPLRHRLISPHEHATLFQNIEKLVLISECHLRQLREQSILYSDVPDQTIGFVDTVGGTYVHKIQVLCDAYEIYSRGLRRAESLLADLKKYNEFNTFLQEQDSFNQKLMLEDFIRQPILFIRQFYRQINVIASSTAELHYDFIDLDNVVQAMEQTCQIIHEHLTLRPSSTSGGSTGSLSQGQMSQENTGDSGSSRSPPEAPCPSRTSTQSIQSTSSLDSDVLDIQSKLIFSSSVPAFTLSTPGRHLIYSGDLLYTENRKWIKLNVLLFSDLILLTKMQQDGRYAVIDEPLNLHEVREMDFDCEHPAEFELVSERGSHDYYLNWNARVVTLRAPTTEQKCTWKSLLSQRISTSCRSIPHELSTERVGQLAIL
ncbi:unnamed protein product [Owenia fusiformis]|uniref:Uncharacterized protein n=1 Tax=Owenia fusiformis TaxID=6347 RepID=A0A8S4P069_OWEFU|nr:unnamed protein product [Owenia fusiformis]